MNIQSILTHTVPGPELECSSHGEPKILVQADRLLWPQKTCTVPTPDRNTKFIGILGDPEVTENIYCKSRNLPNADTKNYSTV